MKLLTTLLLLSLSLEATEKQPKNDAYVKYEMCLEIVKAKNAERKKENEQCKKNQAIRVKKFEVIKKKVTASEWELINGHIIVHQVCMDFDMWGDYETQKCQDMLIKWNNNT